MPDVSTGSVYSVYTVMYIHQESSDLALHNPYIGHLVDKVPGTFNNTIIPPFTGPVQYYGLCILHKLFLSRMKYCTTHHISLELYYKCCSAFHASTFKYNFLE